MLNPRGMWRVVYLLMMALVVQSCLFDGPPPPRPEHSLETLNEPAQTVGMPGRGTGRQAPGAPASGSPASGVVVAAPRSETVAPPAPAAAEPAARYRYNAKFEPPRGRVLHGMGQWAEGNTEYLRMLDDPKLLPASVLAFTPIGEWPRPWEALMKMFSMNLEQDKAAGRFPHVDIAFYAIDKATRRQKGIDTDFLNTDRYDDRIRDLAHILRDLRSPVFLRIGGEFSGSWNDYHAYDYPKAYRKVVEIFRAEGADNVAFIWCYEPSAPDDFDVKDAEGWRWFPGDDVIDWYGLDVFEPDEFTPPQSSGRRGQANKATKAERFLKMAKEHDKPVIIAECSASRIDITPDLEDGRRDWQTWFEPFLKFLDDHPEIEAFHYINTDWRESGRSNANGWLEARINMNSYIASKWIAELHKSKYLNSPDVSELNGYAAACAPLKTTVKAPPADEKGGTGEGR